MQRADGYLLKDTEPDTLSLQIKQITQGEVILSESIKNLLLERQHKDDPIYSLTNREMNVLALIATGLWRQQLRTIIYFRGNGKSTYSQFIT